MANSEDEEVKTPTSSRDIATAVETAGSADESDADDDDDKDAGADSEADNKSDEGEEADGGEEDDADAGKKADAESKDDAKGDDNKSEEKSEYRFTQFAGDGKPESYISNLEKAYENSSAEGIRLNQSLQQATRRVDAIMEAVRGDEDLANKLHAALTGTNSAAAPKGDPAVATDPFLVDAKTQWEKKSTEEADAFIKANPEVVSDPTINAEVKKWMEVFSAEEYKSKGTLMTAGEAMGKAYKYLGYEDKREQRKSLSDAKGAVATTRPQASRKAPKTASDFTDSQVNLAANLGVSKDKLDKFAK